MLYQKCVEEKTTIGSILLAVLQIVLSQQVANSIPEEERRKYYLWSGCVVDVRRMGSVLLRDFHPNSPGVYSATSLDLKKPVEILLLLREDNAKIWQYSRDLKKEIYTSFLRGMHLNAVGMWYILLAGLKRVQERFMSKGGVYRGIGCAFNLSNLGDLGGTSVSSGSQSSLRKIPPLFSAEELKSLPAMKSMLGSVTCPMTLPLIVVSSYTFNGVLNISWSLNSFAFKKDETEKIADSAIGLLEKLVGATTSC
jgi:hypothetical protein